MKEVSLEVCETNLEQMANKVFKTNFSSLISTRVPLFYVTTNEEKRLTVFLDYFSKTKGFDCYTWDCVQALRELKNGQPAGGTKGTIRNAIAILDYIIDEAKSYSGNTDSLQNLYKNNCKGIIYVLLDFFRYIDDNDPNIERRLKIISSMDTAITVIITGPYYKTTDVLNNLMPCVDFPLPNKNEIKNAMNAVIEGVIDKIPSIIKKTSEIEEQLINSVSGLTLTEAQSAFSKSLVVHQDWNLTTIFEEKKQIIRKSGVLEFYDNTTSLNDIGGLDNLREWIVNRESCFSEEAEKYGLEKPRGILLIGCPGSGKSLACKAIGSAWKMPLLRLDFGKLFGSLVGESEQQARNALRMAESISPCILWIDEIEKGLSGAQSSGKSDSGTTSRVLSTFLTWMQEKKAPVFVVATANDHTSIPAEFTRAGRFDEIFFVDLPNFKERISIFSVHIKKRSLDVKEFDLQLLSGKTENFMGSEIEKAVKDAMLVGFRDNKRIIGTIDILTCIKKIKTLYSQRNEQFERLQEYGNQYCVKANSEDVESNGSLIINSTNDPFNNSKKMDL